MKLGIIGDVHGDVRYLDIIKRFDYTLQIGDMSYDYSFLKDVDSTRHKFFPGNHESYDVVFEQPGCLGDFGVYENPVAPLFFVRGAFSIDKKYRSFKVDWFPEEEMSQKEWGDCIEMYGDIKPNILVSHDCPFSVLPHITNPEIARSFGFKDGCIQTTTGLGLDELLKVHKPKVHIFGHHHKPFHKVIDGVEFICVPTLQALEFELK